MATVGVTSTTSARVKAVNTACLSRKVHGKYCPECGTKVMAWDEMRHVGRGRDIQPPRVCKCGAEVKLAFCTECGTRCPPMPIGRPVLPSSTHARRANARQRETSADHPVR